MPETAPAVPDPSAIRDAKRLLRLARTGALATFDRAFAGPLTTLVGVASDWDGAPLFLMSELARHTGNLKDNPRASLLLTSDADRGDPLNQPRLTVAGPIEVNPDPAARARYVRRNPKAKLYAGFADFAIRRMKIESVHFNGGFGRADLIAPDDLLTPAEAIEALAEAEDRLLAEVDGLSEEAKAKLVGGASPGRRLWRAVGLDAEGLDLAAGGASARLDFDAPARTPDEWRQRLRQAIDALAT